MSMIGLYDDDRPYFPHCPIFPTMDNSSLPHNNPSMPPRIKICGITRPEDAAIAAKLGADAIGMIFYPLARRCVSLDTARQILRTLPAFVTPVGLFVDQPIEEMRRIASELRLTTLQLHGHESPETVAALSEFTILKALRTDPATLSIELTLWRTAIATGRLTHLKGLVMETAGATGGTGMPNNFEFLASLQTFGAFAGLPPLIAAGGLRPESVAAVVRLLHPFAVDVSSGVESEFGIKSAEMIEGFVLATLTA